MSVESAVLSALLRSRAKYVESAKSDVMVALSTFTDLSPGTEEFTFPDGITRTAFRLKGTIPVLYKSNTYNIPVALYLWDTHPYYAPVAFVCPTETMMIKESKTVDSRGRIYLPYLSDWRFPGYDISGLLQVMTLCFQDSCPVFTKSRGVQQQPQPSYTPYPIANPPGMPSTIFNAIPPIQNASPYSPPYPPAHPSALVTEQATGSDSNYMKASLLSAVEDKIRQRLREKLGTVHAELASIKQTHSELRAGQQKLKAMLETLEQEQKQMEMISITYQDKRNEITGILSSCPSDEEVDIDSVIDGSTPLHRQLLRCYVQDCAIDDAIYFLGQALKAGRISLPNYLKEVRQLSRKQFIHRATLQKCRRKAKLPL